MAHTHLLVQMTVDDKTIASFCLDTENIVVEGQAEIGPVLAWAFNMVAFALIRGDGEMREFPQISTGMEKGHRVKVVVNKHESTGDWRCLFCHRPLASEGEECDQPACIKARLAAEQRMGV